MGSIVSSFTDAIGLTDHAGQEEAARQSALAADRSYGMTKEQLEFQKQQYEDWKDIYGTLQEQQMDYLQKYTGEDIVAQQLAQTSSEFQGAEKQLTRTLAQRGLSGSGAEAAGLTQLASQQAITKSNIRSSQEDIVAQKKLQFLGLGLGQGTQMLGTQASVAQTGIGAQASIAGQQTALQGQLGAANLNAMGQVIGTAAGAGIKKWG